MEDLCLSFLTRCKSIGFTETVDPVDHAGFNSLVLDFRALIDMVSLNPAVSNPRRSLCWNVWRTLSARFNRV